MKELNTLENKAKFFAQYWGQKVFYDPNYAVNEFDQTGVFTLCPESFDGIEVEPHVLLLLKPLSSITDEDAIKIAKIRGCKNHEKRINWAKKYIENFFDDVAVYQLLIRNGYAAFFVSNEGGFISVEQQIEFGWVKLIA